MQRYFDLEQLFVFLYNRYFYEKNIKYGENSKLQQTFTLGMKVDGLLTTTYQWWPLGELPKEISSL